MFDDQLITIGITCFNAETSIEKAVHTALSQTWPNFEVVVVDDASTDDSLSVLHNLSRDEPRLRVVTHRFNKGVAVTRNTILHHAKGRFIAFFDDDDESDADRLVKQYNRIINYEAKSGADLVICHTARIQFLPDGSQHYEPTIGTKPGIESPNSSSVADQILIGRPIGEAVGSCATCSQMARKDVYEAIGGFDESLRRYEDTDFNVRLAIAGGHFVGISDPLVKQYMTYTTDKNIEEERCYALLWLKHNSKYLKKIGWYEHALQWLDIKYDYLAGRKMRFTLRMLLLLLMYPKRTVTRLYWVWPNRRHSKMAAEWHDKYFNLTRL